MAAAFTQDAVLHFLQVRGGSVKNSDLLLHFRDFLQDGADRDRNRELFKKFVNSVASVRQIDGVSFVVLKKKFQGYVAGSGAAGGSSGPPWVPAGKNAESPALSPALSRDSPRQKAEQKEQTTAAPPGEPAGKAVLPAAGILLKQQVSSTPELLMRPGPARVLSPRPELNKPPDQASKGGQQRVGFGPLPGITPEPPHRGTSPVPETLRGGLQPEVDPHPQLAKRHVKHRQSYKTAVSYDDDDEEEVPMRPGSAGGGRPLNALLGDASSPCIRDRPAPSSAQKVYIQGAEADTRTPRGPAGSIQNSSGNSPKQQVSSTPEGFVRPGPAQVVSHIPDKPELNTPSVSKPPATGQTSKGGQHRVGFAPPPHIASEPPRRETSPVPETLRGGLQPEGNPEPQLIKRRVKHRQSYKAALSYDEEEEEEEEEVVPVMRRGSAGGAWPLNTPLSDTPRVMSTSSPCIIDAPAPPFFPQGVQGTQRVRVTPGLGPGVGPRLEPEGPARRSLPLETERHMPPAQMSHRDTRHAQPAGVHPELKQGSDQSHKPWLSSSHSSIFSPSSDAGFSSSEWPPSDSTRASGWTSSSEDLQSTAGEPVGMPRIQGTVRRAREPEPATHRADGKGTAAWHRSTGHLYDEQEPSARLSPLHRSSEQLHEGRHSAAQGIPWHFSTGDLYDDHEEVESSDSSIISSPYLRQHPGVARRLSVKQRSRMCRSLGTDLDQLHQEEARREMERGGGHEEARQSRLHRISSSLSLRYNLSSSSLSSCSTPPRCQSFASLDESVERGRTKLPTEASPSSTHHEGRSRQSSVPLGSREHAWLVKGAAGTWPDIYSLFREDSSLLNRRDFISGFTVLHWIAKHGDHRVLNTLWYGVEKAGLTFDVNARATSGHTPLHIAAMHGHKNIIHLLVKKFHADVKQRDVAGKRPWQYLSRDAPLEILQLLGAPMRIALTSEGGVGRGNSSWEQQQQQRRQQRHLRHHISSALGERPFTVAGAVKVKRSSSLAAFLKHKSLHRFYAQ